VRARGGAALAAYLVSAAGCCWYAFHGLAHFVDLHVYRMGGDVVLHGGDLYAARFHELPFTYPPFAAVVLAGPAAVPFSVSAALLAAASVAALPLVLYLALRLPDGWPALSSRAAWEIALLAGVAAAWLEPVRTTLGYGQIDLLLALLVLYDLAGAVRSPRFLPGLLPGAAIGVAAGIKLTPGIFIVYLLLTRRYRAATTAAVTFGVTVLVGFAVLPGPSRWYWGGQFANPGHISPVQDPENESLLGVLARTMHTADVTAVWLPIACLVAVTGLFLACVAGRGGNEALGFCFCAITGLLISPISWTHHWVLAVPALLLGGLTVFRGYRAGHARAAVFRAFWLAVLLVLGWLRLARQVTGSNWLGLSASSLASSAIYVICGLGFLAVSAGYWLRRQGAGSSGRGACPRGPAEPRNATGFPPPGSAAAPLHRGPVPGCRRSE
jgi:alpha-1,2-mannosyltransferase